MAHGRVILDSRELFIILLLENFSGIVTGPWCCPPSGFTLATFSVAPPNMDLTTSQIPTPTSDIFIVGVDSNVVPDVSITGISLKILTSAILSVGMDDFMFRNVRAVSSGANPNMSIIAKFSK